MDLSSWLGKAISSLSPEHSESRSRSRHTKQGKHPRWRTPSPMNASMVPPPIVASAYLKPSSVQSPSRDYTPDDNTVTLFHRKQKQLEADLQLLLNAQSERLLSGLGGKSVEDDTTSIGSSTPTGLGSTLGMSNARKHSEISLRQARKELYITMRKLALLKTQEYDDLTPEVDECDIVVTKLEKWERKKELLQERTQQIERGDEHRKVKELRERADDMQNDINDMEAKLAKMKSQQKKLRREASECENEVDAKLSSYTATLEILEKDIKLYLSELQRERSDSASTGHRLEPDDTPLELARRSYNNERSRLRKRQALIEKENDALNEGAAVWKDVVRDVSEFERKLREDMAHLNPSNPSSITPEDAAEDMKSLLAQLGSTTTQLETKYNLAQTRNWNLLVAAIGAELDAFVKGREILEAAFDLMTEKTEEPSSPAASNEAAGDMVGQSMYDDFRTPRSSVIKHVDDEQAIRDLDEAFEVHKNENGTVESSDTESDGPDQDLLVSQHHDTDTD